MTRRALRAAALLALLALAHGSARARLLDPEAFASLGTLVLANGSFTIDTDALQIRDAASTVLFTGVVDDQNGRADSFDDSASGPLGIPEIAVFTFDSIDVQSTATITLIGSRALALLSRGNATIDAVLDASGTNAAGAVVGSGRTGGFAGGTGAMSGVGPGGGGYTTASGFDSTSRAGGGAFRGAGLVGRASDGNPVGSGGVPYGGLGDSLQGGSGGGGFRLTSGPDFGGGGGGGAAEIGALGALVIGSNATLRSNGGNGAGTTFPAARGGGGGGGGLRLHGASVQRQGSLAARGGSLHNGVLSGGGGRVFLSGGVLDLAEVAALTATSLTTSVDLVGSSSAPASHGVLTFAPFLTVVGAGETHALATTVLQAQSSSAPGVELVSADIRVLGFGEVSVPPAGVTNDADVVLGFEEASVVGTGVLTNAGRLAGPGRMDVPLVNTNDGRLEVVDGVFAFEAAVVNALGGTIDAIEATLDFTPGGLANSGALRLVDATVAGPVVNAAGATPAVGGTSTFTGAVSGAASFSGPGTVVFAGSYAPGGSPGLVSFAGNVVFSPASTLVLEIVGIAPGTGHDRIAVAGSATLGGALDLDAANVVVGQTYAVLAHGARSGEFGTVAGIQTGAGLDLAIAYGATATTLTSVRRGDVNRDGLVDAADSAVVTTNLGAATTDYTRGDVNGDGAVNATDQGIVMAAASTPIPALSREGAALLAILLVSCALAVGGARRLSA